MSHEIIYEQPQESVTSNDSHLYKIEQIPQSFAEGLRQCENGEATDMFDADGNLLG